MPGKVDGLRNWIRRFLKEEPPRSTSIVITVFGDAIAPHGGAVWLGTLIELLKPFGINERLVRTSVFRLAEEGWLESRREGRRSLYALSPSGLRRFEHADRRIYAPSNKGWNGDWTLVVLPRTSNGPAPRAALRRELEWDGFASIAPGVFAHPAANWAALQDILQNLKLQNEVLVFSAREQNHFPTLPIREITGHYWELDRPAEGYRRFIARFQPVLEILRGKGVPDASLAFTVRTLLIHSFRRVILDDPVLPTEMLPADWPGGSAYALCGDIYRHTQAQAEKHLLATLKGAEGRLAEAAPSFYQRFGGL